MKIRFFALPLLCASALALAEGKQEVTTPPASAAASAAVPAAAASPMKASAPARKRTRVHRHLRLPRGDLRMCLELPNSTEIITCAEKGCKP